MLEEMRIILNIQLYTNTALHELGHALGWLGHSSNSADVMSQDTTNPTTLTDRDIDHIEQIY